RIGNADVLEDELARIGRAEPALAVERLAPVRLPVPLEDERGDALVLFGCIRLREYQREARHRAVRDPHLASAQHPRVAVALRAGAQLRRVASDLRLGEAKAADDLALAETRQPALFLLLLRELADRLLLGGEVEVHRAESIDARFSAWRATL